MDTSMASQDPTGRSSSQRPLRPFPFPFSSNNAVRDGLQKRLFTAYDGCPDIFVDHEKYRLTLSLCYAGML